MTGQALSQPARSVVRVDLADGQRIVAHDRFPETATYVCAAPAC
jgi:hypothetical protein